MSIQLVNDHWCCGFNMVGGFHFGRGASIVAPTGTGITRTQNNFGHPHPAIEIKKTYEVESAKYKIHRQEHYNKTTELLPAVLEPPPYDEKLKDEVIKWALKGQKCFVGAIVTDHQDENIRAVLLKNGFKEVISARSTTRSVLTFYMWVRPDAELTFVHEEKDRLYSRVLVGHK